MLLPKSPYLPNPRLVAEYISRRRYSRIQRREESGKSRQWFLLCGRAEKTALLNPQPASLQKLMPPSDRTWADPFLWKAGDDWFIFCEEWCFDRPHGHISVLRLDKKGQAVESCETVLALGHHLSYPFLFEYAGELHMIPEAGASRSIDVYCCEEFPGRWRKRATLMRDLDYVDATLFPQKGRWWLFLTIRRGFFGLNRDLFLFWADAPLAARWTPHPRNPVVRGIKRARPAGRLFEVEGRVFRPSQDCMVRYGYGLNINEVLQLGPDRYNERVVRTVTPDWGNAIRATHHIDWHDGMLVMDAQRLFSGAGAPRDA